MNKNVLLSFDLSTTVCGISLFDIKEKKLISLDYYRLKSETMLDKGIELEKLIDRLVMENYVHAFCIEERLKSFRAGGTNAEAMTKLVAINFLCQFLFKKRNIPVYEINVNTARSNAYPGFHTFARKIKNMKQKEVAFNFAIKEIDLPLPKKIMKSGANKGKEVYLEEAKDMTDAYTLGKSCLILNFAEN